MADLSDVLNAIVNTVAGLIYPNGSGQGSAILANGTPIGARIYAGWPIPAQLDKDLAAGLINVSVFAPSGMERNTTRYTREWIILTPAVHTLAATIGRNGTTVTLSGAVSTPQNTAIICNGKGYLYSVQASDTLATIATALAALVNVDTPASASGAVVTIPAAKSLVARIGGVATAQREIRRQERQFQISFWCPPGSSGISGIRDAAVGLVDPFLAAMNFIALADGSQGRFRYVRSYLDDGIQKANCYRRDLFYTVEYGTTQTVQAPEIIAVQNIDLGAALDFSQFTETDPPPQTITF